MYLGQDTSRQEAYLQRLQAEAQRHLDAGDYDWKYEYIENGQRIRLERVKAGLYRRVV